MLFHFYMIFVILISFLFSMKTDRKLLCFFMVLWILSQPVLNAYYIVPLPGLPFELQPNRILFLFAIGYLIYAMVFKIKPSSDIIFPFEKYIYIYLVIVIFALSVNFSHINPKNMFAIPLEIITFISVLILTKRYATEKVFAALLEAIVFLSALCTAIAIIQLFANSLFFRTGDLRTAFGEKFRSTGIFQSEYEFGYFQILAFITLLIKYRTNKFCLFLAPMVAFSIILTFHRLDYLIFLFCSTIFISLHFKHKFFFPVFAFLGILCLVLFLVFADLYQTMGWKNTVVEERFKANTITGRFLQYKVVANSLVKFPLGLGGYENPEYIKLMKLHGMTKSITMPDGRHKILPLGVHNGYLAAGLQYGLFAMLTFLLIVGSMLNYYRKKMRSKHLYAEIPFFMTIIWAIANLSNSASIFRAYFVILASLLMGSQSALSWKRKKIDNALKE